MLHASQTIPSFSTCLPAAAEFCVYVVWAVCLVNSGAEQWHCSGLAVQGYEFFEAVESKQRASKWCAVVFSAAARLASNRTQLHNRLLEIGFKSFSQG